MAKSLSRSPRWKPRIPLERSPERNRHRNIQDPYHNNDDFHRDSRRSKHWEDEQHRQSNCRTESYSHFSDNFFEHGSFDTNQRRSPFEAINRLKRAYSPERREESNRRFPPKCPEDTNYRGNTRNFHNHRNHERNGNNNNVHNNGFKAARREDNFQRPYNRGYNKGWHKSDDHWNQHDPENQYLSPHRRRPEEHERKSFQKRYPEDDYREHEPLHKRAREVEQQDFRSPLKSSHWKGDHPERPYNAKDWSKDADYKGPTPFVHEKHSGALTKIEYDSSHRSPTYVYTKLILEDEYVERHNHSERQSRHEERKNESTRSSQYHRTSDSDIGERRRYDNRSLEPLSRYSSKNHDDNTVSKNSIDMKYATHKHKEKTRKEGDYQRTKEDEYQKNPPSPLHLESSQTPDPKGVLKITSEKESIVVNLALKKSSDKYRQPHEQRNKPKHLPSPSNTTQGLGISQEKQIIVGDMQKRGNATSKDRQLSHDLVAVAGKEMFHPVFEHLEPSLQGPTNAPNSEFTKEIITIIHEVKANHFRSAGMSLHDRFTKLQEESSKQELKLTNTAPQTNPEIHRRIDISLEELQSKSLHKTVDVASSHSHRLVEDPNDLRHDIERRRKQRLHSGQNGTTDISYGDSDPSSSCYVLPHQETGEFQSSRVSRPPFRKSIGRPPVRGAYYRGNSNQYYTSRNFEDTDEIRRPYKGWGNPAARI
ncbi:PREDICTED: uncharacterized protein CXorf23 homolog [Nanorana parkeri]|uniref:uncharacterized protein CXorf23 homolog n=1 Tax=Nanorana parkeri TaxID=125878 RepID=UPI0008550472|nr:PREDICTED: uncharacterized protein CXorf23 homolog [Nanorana parkeri]